MASINDKLEVNAKKFLDFVLLAIEFARRKGEKVHQSHLEGKYGELLESVRSFGIDVRDYEPAQGVAAFFEGLSEEDLVWYLYNK
ncbi:hypothetical protein HY638_01385 [Candidatus Woesearchaeota archaeon]|nr:hypothetical protein [Candidatus Woesearchaeota archaeon]